MDPAANRPGSVALLVGLVLLVAIAGLLICFIPLAQCPECTLERQWFVADLVAQNKKTHEPCCPRCKDKSRITLLNRWLKGEGPD